MKTKQRVALALSILCLFAWGGSFAEAPALTLESFSLRNGYTFGMSKEDAMKLAEEEGLEVGESPHELALAYRNVSVSNYVAAEFFLNFDAIFGETPGLYGMVYAFEPFPIGESDDHSEMFESLKAGLIQKYDEPRGEASDGTVFWNPSVVSIALGSTVDLELDCEYYYLRYSLPYKYLLTTEEPLPTATKSLIGL